MNKPYKLVGKPEQLVAEGYNNIVRKPV